MSILTCCDQTTRGTCKTWCSRGVVREAGEPGFDYERCHPDYYLCSAIVGCKSWSLPVPGYWTRGRPVVKLVSRRCVSAYCLGIGGIEGEGRVLENPISVLMAGMIGSASSPTYGASSLWIGLEGYLKRKVCGHIPTTCAGHVEQTRIGAVIPNISARGAAIGILEYQADT